MRKSGRTPLHYGHVDGVPWYKFQQQAYKWIYILSIWKTLITITEVKLKKVFCANIMKIVSRENNIDTICFRELKNSKNHHHNLI